MPSSFEEFESEKNEESLNLPPPFTLPYDVVIEEISFSHDVMDANDATPDNNKQSFEKIDENKSSENSVASLPDTLAENPVDSFPDDLAENLNGNLNENLNGNLDGNLADNVHENSTDNLTNNSIDNLTSNSTDNSSHDLCEKDTPTENKDELPLESPFEKDSSLNFNLDFSLDSNFQEEEYALGEISLDDLENHYAEVTTSFSEVHTPFLEDAHGALFPPQAKDLFLGKNKETNELEYEEIDWDVFIKYCISHEFPQEYMPYIRLSSAKIHGDECLLRISSDCALHQLNVVQKEVGNFLVDFLGKTIKIRYAADAYGRRTITEMMIAMHEHPQIKMLQKEFGASLLRCSDINPGYKDTRR